MFSLSSVRVYVERGVLVWVALAVVFCAAAAYIESWTLIGWGAGAAIGAGWLVSFFGAGIIHELGHVLVLRHYGLRTTWAQIGLTGAAVHTPGSLGPPELVWVFMAGPVANLVAGAPVALIMIFAVGSSPPLALGFVAW
ncbi:MAG: hypothetical protein ACRDWV_01020, partial [Acidimicrobiales bacterium]